VISLVNNKKGKFHDQVYRCWICNYSRRNPCYSRGFFGYASSLMLKIPTASKRRFGIVYIDPSKPKKIVGYSDSEATAKKRVQSLKNTKSRFYAYGPIRNGHIEI
jgi:hypothetical protein